MYARAFLEGRLTAEQLENFRRELRPGGGLSSYPHPWLMQDFWQFPTVSMGLGPVMAIYQARFMRYWKTVGSTARRRKFWAFWATERRTNRRPLVRLPCRPARSDNLIFVINCNLQRLDGPVRGNGQIIPELEAIFRGAGWNVIKVMWGREWDALLAKDRDGLLVKRMGEVVDGQYQKYAVSSGAYVREHFWGVDPRLLEMVKHLSDEQLKKLSLGGHDPLKVYNAYKAAVEHKGSPTVILARTVKGYGLGEAGEGRNITHQQKKLNEDELRAFRTRFGIPISDDEVAEAPFYRPSDDSPEIKYLRERRQALGGSMPKRSIHVGPLEAPLTGVFDEFFKGTEGRTASTTMVFVRMLAKLMRDPDVGHLVVRLRPRRAPSGWIIVPTSRHLFARGQIYEAVDMDTLPYNKGVADGQIPKKGSLKWVDVSSCAVTIFTYGVTRPVLIFYSSLVPADWRLIGARPIEAAASRAEPRADDASRGGAASGRQQPSARVPGAQCGRVRSGVCVRTGRDHRGWPAQDVR